VENFSKDSLLQNTFYKRTTSIYVSLFEKPLLFIVYRKIV